MKQKITKSLLIQIIVLTTAVLLSIELASAGGFGLTPSVLSVSNALKGNEYWETIMVMNGGDTPVTVNLATSGAAASWIKFYNLNNLEEEITTIEAAPNKLTGLKLKINIPEDTANGEYAAKIEVNDIPSGNVSGNGSQSVNLVVISSIVIEVVGNQELRAETKGISAQDVESGQPARISVQIANKGNVVAKPTVELTIFKDDKQIDHLIFDNIVIDVGDSPIIDLDWNTEGWGLGIFKANVKVYMEGNLLEEKDLEFNVFARGTLTSELSILSIDDPENINLNELAKFEVKVLNSGEIDAIAKISGEVYLNDALIDKISSDEVLVKVNQAEVLTAYFKPVQNGKYAIKRNVVFEGKKLNLTDFDFELKNGEITEKLSGVDSSINTDSPIKKRSSSFLIGLITILLIAGMVIALAGFFIMNRKKIREL